MFYSFVGEGRDRALAPNPDFLPCGCFFWPPGISLTEHFFLYNRFSLAVIVCAFACIFIPSLTRLKYNVLNEFLRVYVSSLIPEIRAEERASMSCLNAFSCVLFQTNIVFFLVKSRRGAVIVAKFGMYFDLLFAIPKRLRTSKTFVSFDAFLSALMRLGSGWHPSFEKIWPKNSRVSRVSRICIC